MKFVKASSPALNPHSVSFQPIPASNVLNNPAINSVEEEDHGEDDSEAKEVEEAIEGDATFLIDGPHLKSVLGAPEKHPTATESQPWDPGTDLQSDQDKT